MALLNPLTMRDFSRGVIRTTSVNDFLTPPNSVSHALNVNFDTIIGSGVVRLGTAKLGATVASGQSPLGLTTFTTSNLATNVAVGVFKGASNASLYWYNTSWITSSLTSLSNTAKNRFAQLGNRLFIVNGTDAMKSTSGGTTWDTTNCMTTRVPSLIISNSARLLTSGDSAYRSRVWFSSIIDPTASPTITWIEDATVGDFIDINPDDGAGDITGFSPTATLVLVFKKDAMYRLDAIAKTVNPDNIFNIGAVSQEAITVCQGITYFFSGRDIRSTNGDYPQQISRLGVQDFIDAIPQSNWSNVYGWSDDWNVYFSIGDVTLRSKQNDQTAYSRVILKFSTRDNSWSVHSYAQQFRNGVVYTTTAGRNLIVADTLGNVQTLNSGYTDNGTSIFYELVTQGQEFGNLAHSKTIADKLVVFCDNGQASQLEAKINDGNFKPLEVDLNDRVNVCKNVNLTGEHFNFRWFGSSTGNSPIFEGFYFENITDEGIVK